MESILRISEAASLAIHAVMLIAQAPEERPVTVPALAEELGVSKAHLSKVLQELTKRGIVHSKRGPGGGYTLAKESGDLTLLDVYEAVEGPFPSGACLLGRPVCHGKCLFGGMLGTLNNQVRTLLAESHLSALRPGHA